MQTENEWAERRVMTVLGTLVEEARSVIEPNLVGLTDAEYFWEPEPGAWSVRLIDQVRTPDAWGRGDWRVEVDFADAQPPTTTIGWRLMHAFDCTTDYASKAFGHGPRDWHEIAVAGTAHAAVAMMTGAIADLQGEIRAATDEVLLGPGDSDGRPRWRLLDKALIEAIHHCAEIGALRSERRRSGARARGVS